MKFSTTFLLAVVVVLVVVTTDAHVIGRRGSRGLNNNNNNNNNRHRRTTTGTGRAQQQQLMSSIFPCHDRGSAYNEQDCPPPPTPNPSRNPPPTSSLPTSPPSSSSSISLLPALELVVGNTNTNNNGLAACTGPCNNSNDCFGDLKCWSDGATTASVSSKDATSSSNTNVPGCSGVPMVNTKYCYNPSFGLEELMDVGNNGIPERSFPLQLCQGDCDSDQECDVGLTCFQRSGTEEVPGCSDDNQQGKSGNDYCIRIDDNNGNNDNAPPTTQPPPPPSREPTQKPTTFAPTTSLTPMIDDDDTGLVPPQQQLMDVGNNGIPEGSFPLQLCQGDCDSDQECDVGLTCFQRSGTEEVPGCSDDNEQGKSGNDYCIRIDNNDNNNNDNNTPSTTKPPEPTQKPTTFAPTEPTTLAPINDETGLPQITYQPGNFSWNHRSDDGMIRLSNGLGGEVIALTGERVSFHNGDKKSVQEFHIAPDGAAVFEKDDNSGGWYYVSNAENITVGTNYWNGGVGAIEFDTFGHVVGYQRIANRMRNNCGGGKTPWNSWMTCEEADRGQVYQVDPTGTRAPRVTAMGTLGTYESFAYDIYTDPDHPKFFVTRDAHNGVITRFIPNDEGMECYRQINDYDRWCTLEHGSRDYLVIDGGPSGQYIWTTNLTAAKENAEQYYKNNEGIDSYQGYLYFTSKKEYRLVILNLKEQTYTYESTKSGSFNAQPDQVARILNGNGDIDDDHNDDNNKILYFCEDGGRRRDGPGVFGRNVNGTYFTILYSDSFPFASETTGLAYSPNGHDMYVSYQEAGRIYRFYRRDGRPFHGNMLDIKYHAT